MKSVALTAAAAVVACVSPAAASAAVIVTAGETAEIPLNNDFQSQLAALGLTRYTSTGAQLVLETASSITFEFLGSESGLNDRFTALGTTVATLTETTSLTDNFAAPVLIGSAVFAAGDLVDRLVFSTSDSQFASSTVGQGGFAIFLGPDQTDGAVSRFYLGYDDLITGADDDYDDFIVRATVSALPAVPEPATWALMILGFGAIGAAMRPARRADDARFRIA